jgi:poly(hydroxyalkanoate) depolymerase family esterase
VFARIRYRTAALFHAAFVLLAASSSVGATWATGVSYGGPSAPTMDLYVPDSTAASPGIVVALHYCGGNPGATHAWFQTLADQYGFIVVAPGVGPDKDCWSATPTRSGEPAAIAQMIGYVLAEHHADSKQVYSVGASSGACMTNALLAAYPDVFAGGSVLAGVPAGAWTGGSSCSICGQNPPAKTGAEWGDIVRGAAPGFTGPRPRVQLWHGTGDMTLNYPTELDAEVAQWTNVFGLTGEDATTEMNTPRSGWTRAVYRQGAGTVVLEVNIGQGQQHDLTNQNLWGEVVHFFGLDARAAAGESGMTGGSGGRGTAAGGRHAGGKGGRGGAATGAPGTLGGRGGAPGTSGGIGDTKGGSAMLSDPPEITAASDGGCTCRASGEPSSGRAIVTAGLGLALLVGRRRRKSGAHPPLPPRPAKARGRDGMD